MTPADPATIARNLAAAQRFVEGVLGGADPAALSEVVAEGVVVDTGLKPEGKITGRDEYGRVLGATLGAAFSNGRMEIKDIAPLADGRVMVRFEASADNTGPLNDIAAPGRRFTFCELHLMRAAMGQGRPRRPVRRPAPGVARAAARPGRRQRVRRNGAGRGVFWRGLVLLRPLWRLAGPR